MRRLWVVLALSWAGMAHGQVFSTGQAAWAPGKMPYFGSLDGSFPVGGSTSVLSLPFSAPGCYASGTAMGTRGEAVSITRAGSAWYEDATGAVQTCTANQMRVAPQGLLVERASTTYAFATEAIGSWNATSIGSSGRSGTWP